LNEAILSVTIWKIALLDLQVFASVKLNGNYQKDVVGKVLGKI